jgi:CubicO group peptidase (beta-lactamase class C family)/beta-glucosidase-like glycosyl hydrolase
MHKKVWVVFIAVWAVLPVYAQSSKSVWIDSVFNTLSLPDKIGQLLMIPVDGSANQNDLEKTTNIIRRNKIGGVVVSGGGPAKLVRTINQLQHESEVPVLVGMNAEQGPGAVIDSVIAFPDPIMLGAVRDDSLIWFLGEQIGRQLKALGVHLNFAPTTDLSTSFNNPELFVSSYGENKNRVTHKIVTYQAGLKKEGVLCIAKHYPDNGIRVEGFHKGVPVLRTNTDPARLYPLQIMIDNGLAGVVTAYEHEVIFPDKKRRFADRKRILSDAVPSLYSGKYLKQQVNLKGLVFSFIPDIQELNKKYKAGDAEVFAFQAGNDVLLFPKNINATIRKMRRAIRKNKVLEKQLDESVNKILALKYDAGLNKRSSVKTENLHERLNNFNALALRSILVERSITVVKDDQNMLPVKELDRSFASLSIGAQNVNEFSTCLSKYVPVVEYGMKADTTGLYLTLNKHDVIIAAIYPNGDSLVNQYTHLLQRLSATKKVITVLFDSPARISHLEKLPAIVEAYSPEADVQKIAAQIIFGALQAKGTLPVSITSSLPQGLGIESISLKRLGYAVPEMAGVNSRTLDKITRIATDAVNQKATPGCQVIIARKGKVIYESSFGWQMYDQKNAITNQSIYDLASLTKVTATLPVSMFLYERGLLDIYKKASYYLPELNSTNKKDLIVKDILTHQAGLIPFIPFWVQTVKDSVLMPAYYSHERSEAYPLQISPTVFGIKSLPDSLWLWSIKSKLREKPVRTPYSYIYSDIGLYIMHHINEKLINQAQQDFLQQNLYDPLGASTMGYLPLERFDPLRIVPTENDKLFRRELLTGTVHDEGAAMLGGLAGHAGNFSNASDLLKLGQMFLQKGYYGGYQYYKPETVDYFTAKQFDTSRRGLGWDKPVQSDWVSPASILASPKTFGHTGFTGTCMWIDPEFDLVFIFLSNRVYPTRNNNKLSSLNIRSRIQDVIYQSVFEYGKYGENQFSSKVIPYILKISN